MDEELKSKKKNKKKVIRRGHKHKKESTLTILSNNVAGLKNKTESLKAEIMNSNVALFTLQESHFTKKGRLKVDGFEIFEAIRNNKKDGGTVIGAFNSLNPILVKEYK